MAVAIERLRRANGLSIGSIAAPSRPEALRALLLPIATPEAGIVLRNVRRQPPESLPTSAGAAKAKLGIEEPVQQKSAGCINTAQTRRDPEFILTRSHDFGKAGSW